MTQLVILARNNEEMTQENLFFRFPEKLVENGAERAEQRSKNDEAMDDGYSDRCSSRWSGAQGELCSFIELPQEKRDGKHVFAAQDIIESSEHVAKGHDYELLVPWLGDGLLLR